MIAQNDIRSAALGWARGVSLVIAGTSSLLLIVYPYVLNGIPDWRVHTGLLIMMLGAAGLFMFGLGFQPRNRLVRGIFHPALAWLLFVVGVLTMVARG